MRTLAIDTSGDFGVVAITDGGEVRVEMHSRVRSRHGETLLPTIERALALAELDVAAIDLLAVGLGPGSFTGVRIGVSTVKGLALARGTPVVGVRTTRVIARGLFGALRVPVIDAHKGEVFVAVYEADARGALTTRLDETHGPPERAAQAIRDVIGAVLAGSRAERREVTPVLAGSGLALYRDRLLGALGDVITAPRVLDVPRGALLALEAEEALAARGPDDLASLEPLYVRASDAVLPGSSRDA
ncbi:tRNA (adenosine(37)-N6)-threonylcarbamoyltransferase complex dimerization subunit type 1 TsaB [Sandaracinus amylolyticus]|uniref:tRNA (adenosine(37)-N6)-threonylcarbamoyltransferase complex dimerization subunit type 1 TsaB n=1 Tax=Sandaracinus amylolyticus TaxID=927083 RepID=UPI001F2395E1|nr:tRNA (adenosine(37)-N6)-threonylcarbamoyltransferase complex dimerization subunit type 1 TsaB [Sandaracinus amylolyticus]UJR83106.1 Hypothetical protein I5071_51720 [Sandaracinus amylolyticus]